MDSLVELLKSGGYSCVIETDGQIRTYSQRGIKDLHHLFHNEPHILLAASVADKVVGVGAAAIMIAAGVDRLYAITISKSAFKLLRKSGIDVECENIVDNIINRDKTDSCPLEKLCSGITTIERLIPVVDAFVINANNG